jgi:hypothetical protein
MNNKASPRPTRPARNAQSAQVSEVAACKDYLQVRREGDARYPATCAITAWWTRILKSGEAIIAQAQTEAAQTPSLRALNNPALLQGCNHVQIIARAPGRTGAALHPRYRPTPSERIFAALFLLRRRRHGLEQQRREFMQTPAPGLELMGRTG